MRCTTSMHSLLQPVPCFIVRAGLKFNGAGLKFPMVDIRPFTAGPLWEGRFWLVSWLPVKQKWPDWPNACIISPLIVSFVVFCNAIDKNCFPSCRTSYSEVKKRQESMEIYRWDNGKEWNLGEKASGNIRWSDWTAERASTKIRTAP